MMRVLFFIVQVAAIALLAGVAMWFTQFSQPVMVIGIMALFAVGIVYLVTFGATMARWLEP